MVQPLAVEVHPDNIRIMWDDGHVSNYPPRYLRGSCRCAACIHEMTGRRMVGVKDVPEDVEALDWMKVGRYALQFLWSDAHDTGIYPFQALRMEMCPCPECKARRGEA